MGRVPAFLDSHTYPFVSSRLVWEGGTEGGREGGKHSVHALYLLFLTSPTLAKGSGELIAYSVYLPSRTTAWVRAGRWSLRHSDRGLRVTPGGDLGDGGGFYLLLGSWWTATLS